jgi:hypothetical protein
LKYIKELNNIKFRITEVDYHADIRIHEHGLASTKKPGVKSSHIFGSDFNVSLAKLIHILN